MGSKLTPLSERIQKVNASLRSAAKGKRQPKLLEKTQNVDEVLLRSKIESGLGGVHHSVRVEIQKLLENNKIFAAEQKLLEYVVTEDHQAQINAASTGRRAKTKRENRKFVIWITIIPVVIIVAYLLMGAPWLWTGKKP